MDNETSSRTLEFLISTVRNLLWVSMGFAAKLFWKSLIIFSESDGLVPSINIDGFPAKLFWKGLTIFSESDGLVASINIVLLTCQVIMASDSALWQFWWLIKSPIFQLMVSAVKIACYFKPDFHSRILLAASKIFVNHNYGNKSNPKFSHMVSEIILSEGHLL